MNKITLINILSTLILQFITIISGFIIPRLILENFGSNVNGLISSITQFLNYITLIEGGISSVIMASLYTPLFKGDKNKISSIIVATNNFFKKIGYVFIVYSLTIAIVYPFFINTSFDWKFVFSLTLILGISLFIQYYFSLTWRLLLQADRKVYVSSIIQSIVIILNTLLTIIAINICRSIQMVKLISSISFVIQPILFNLYINKKYEIDLKVKPDDSALSQRWDGFGINVAAFLHGNTDIIVLTLFSTLKNVSIYSVYNLVAMGIRTLITSISSGIIPNLGRNFAENNIRKLNDTFSMYELIIFFTTFTVYTCAIILIIPFVLIYTKGIHDANYNQSLFSVLLILSMGVFCLREPYVNMAYTAGKFKEVSKYAYGEAIINIILSVILVYLFGLNGVALGTFCSMSYRTICQVLYLKNNIIYRSPYQFLKKVGAFFVSSCVGLTLCKYLFGSINNLTWISWIVFAIKNTSVVVFINLVVSFIFFKNDFKKKGTEK